MKKRRVVEVLCLSRPERSKFLNDKAGVGWLVIFFSRRIFFSNNLSSQQNVASFFFLANVEPIDDHHKQERFLTLWGGFLNFLQSCEF